MDNRFRLLPEPKLPLWWKVWAAFCVTVGLTVLVVVLWAIVKLVNKYA